MNYCKSFENLIDALQKLPGIGRKSAERMAYELINLSNFDTNEFTKSIIDAKASIKRCTICGNITDQDICECCSSNLRDKSTICVVQLPKDVYAIDKSNSYNGLYHVLNGALSPLNGIGPEQLNIDSLLSRINDDTKEIIIATNPTPEGEATALYLSKVLSKYNVIVSRIAYGIPMGSNLDYTDQFTIEKALEGRRKL